MKERDFKREAHEGLAKLGAEKGRKAIKKMEAEEKKKQELMQMLAPFDDGVAYNRDEVIRTTSFFLTTTAISTIQSGKGLILLKENEGHGEFIKIIGEQIGLDRSTANYYMRVARTFAELPAFHKFGPSQLRVLTNIPFDELQKADESGQLLDTALDEVARMPVRELREKVRQQEKKIDKGKEEAQKRLEKIDRMEDENQKLKDTLIGKGKDFRTDEEKDFAAKAEIFLRALNGSIGGALFQFEKLSNLETGKAEKDRLYVQAGGLLSQMNKLFSDFIGKASDKHERVFENTDFED